MSNIGYRVELKTPEEIERDAELKQAYERGYEEGAKAEREKRQAEHDKLIAVIDEKIAKTRVAATNKALDSLIGIFANRYCTNTDIEHGDIPRIALDELAIEIENLRSPVQKQPSTAVEDITVEGAAIVQKYKEQTRSETIWEVLKHLKFNCPGGEATPICDMCNANLYCIELRLLMRKQERDSK